MTIAVQAQGLAQDECANVSRMDGEDCHASRRTRGSPVFNGPAVAHVESAEDGIPVHSSSLHHTMSPLSFHIFCRQKCIAAPVLLGGKQHWMLHPLIPLACMSQAPCMMCSEPRKPRAVSDD